MFPRFGRSDPELRFISNNVLYLIYSNFHNKLRNFNQGRLSSVQLERFAQAVHDPGAALNNCWGFTDGTIGPLCRPGENQRILYIRHKRVHAIKFQSVVTPSGMTAKFIQTRVRKEARLCSAEHFWIFSAPAVVFTHAEWSTTLHIRRLCIPFTCTFIFSLPRCSADSRSTSVQQIYELFSSCGTVDLWRHPKLFQISRFKENFKDRPQCIWKDV